MLATGDRRISALRVKTGLETQRVGMTAIVSDTSPRHGSSAVGSGDLVVSRRSSENGRICTRCGRRNGRGVHIHGCECFARSNTRNTGQIRSVTVGREGATRRKKPDARQVRAKRLMATDTALLKTTLANRIERLSVDGVDERQDVIEAIAHAVEPGRRLAVEQLAGAAAIAGTARNVTVSGAAGTGKTTMLRIAAVALRRHGRNMIIVAPTKKASNVAAPTVRSSCKMCQLIRSY